MIFKNRPVETVGGGGGGGGRGLRGLQLTPSQILTKVDLLPIDNNSEN